MSLPTKLMAALSVVCIIALVLAAGTAAAQVPMKCDANADGVIDQIDINIIKLSRNLPVIGINDPRDANSNGRIDIEDTLICTKRCTRPQCSIINIPPTARAGADLTAGLGEVVGLNGTASTDPEGHLLTYRWTIVTRPAGSAAVLSGPTVSTPTITMDVSGSYLIRLVVNDGLVDSVPDDVVVSSVNSRPRANAGSGQTIALGAKVTLNGSASSDPDGDPITFFWRFTLLPKGSLALLSDASSISPTFVADKAGNYVVELVVSDATFASLAATVTITTGNTLPVANAGPAQTRDHGQSIILDGSKSFDADGDLLTYQWSLIGRPAGSGAALTNASAVNPTLFLDLPGNYVAQLIVNDGSSNSSPSTVAITGANTAGLANAGPDQSVPVGNTVTLNGSGSTDVDGDPLTYSWSIISAPLGSTAVLSNPAAVMPTFVPNVLGSYVIQLLVNDTFVNSAADTVVISVGSSNLPPVANAGANQTLALSATANLDGSASFDPEGSALSYAWTFASKPGLSTTVLVGNTTATPSFVIDVIGTYVIQLIVSDGSLLSAPATVTISTANTPPTANAGIAQNVSIGALVQLNGSASFDPEGQSLTFSWSLLSVPPGSTASISNAALINPLFTADLAGTYVAQLIVSDGIASSAPVTVTIIAGSGLPLVSISAATPNASESGPVNGLFTFTRTGSTTAPLNVPYTVTGSAANGTDYTTISTAASISAGQSFVNLVIAVLPDNIVEGTETVILTIQPNAAYNIGAAAATVNIADNPPVVSVNATIANASEVGPVNGLFTFTRNGGDTTQSLGVTFTVGGTATNGVDYTTIPTTISFASGQTSVTVPVNVLIDNVVDPNETVILTIQTSPAYAIGTAIATVTIADDAALVSVVATTPNAVEIGPVNGQFTFTRIGGNIAAALNASFSISGTANNGLDYNTISSPITFLAGQTSVALTIVPINDGVPEPNETIILTVLSNAAHGVGANGSDTVTIADGVTTLTLTLPLTPLAGTSTGTVTLPSPAPIGGTTVNLSSANTSILTVPASVVIPAGQTSIPFTISGIALGSTTITATSPPLVSATNNAAVTNNALTIGNLTLGPTATGNVPVSLSTVAPAGGVTVILTSSNPAVATISPATAFVPAGSLLVPANPTVTAGSILGTTTLTATAPGYVSGSSVVTVSLTASLTPNPISLFSGRTDPMTITLSQPAPVGGLTVNLTSSDPTKFTVPATTIIPQGNASVVFNLTGIAAGNGNTISASSPQISTATAVVNVAPPPVITFSIGNLGQDLQAGGAIYLGAPAPLGGVNVTLTSSTPTSLVIAPNATTAGTGSLVVNILAGNSSASFTYQALQNNGSVVISASAPGYTSGTGTSILRPSGFAIASGNITTTTLSGNTSVNACAYQLTPGTLVNEGQSTLRFGVTPVSLALSSSNVSAGTITNSPQSISGNQTCVSQSGPQFQFAPAAAGVTTLSIAPAGGYSVPSFNQTVTATVSAPVITFSIGNLGQDLQAGGAIYLGAPAPAGGTLVSISSSDPTRMLISPNATTAGSASIIINIAAGGSSASFTYQALQDNGTVTVTASAPAFTSGSGTSVLRPTGFAIASGAISTTTLSGSTSVNVCAYQLSPSTLANEGQSTLRFGVAAVSVVVNSNNGVTGTITNSPLTISGNQSCVSQSGSQYLFAPAAAGSAILSITQPSGYGLPNFGQAIGATVTAPAITIGIANIGQDLQASGSIYLGAPAPAGGLAVTITSSDSSRLLVAPNTTTMGSASMMVNFTAGQSSASFTYQALQDNGNVTVTASAPAYTSGTSTTILRPTGFGIANGNINTTTLSGNASINVCAYQLTPGTFVNEGQSTLRFGITPVSIIMGSSNAVAGVITNSPLTINGNQTCVSQAGSQFQFAPSAAGITLLAITQPGGYAVPGNISQSITATVSAPTISVTVANLGRDLQNTGTISLSVGAPVGGLAVTITPDDTSRLAIAPNATSAGSTSLVVNIPAGQSNATFTYQALQDNGTITLTAIGPGFASGVGIAVLRPSGFAISTSNISTTVAAGNSSVQVCVYQLAPSTNVSEGAGTLRFGITPAVVALASSATSIGTILASPLQVLGNQQCLTTPFIFTPVSIGSTSLTLNQGVTFTVPNGLSQTITAIVN